MKSGWQLVLVAVLAGSGGAAWLWWPDGQAVDAQVSAPVRKTAVAVATVTQGQVRETAEAIGTTRAREAVTITAKTSGIIESIAFTDGQKVEAGTELARLDDAEARARVASAQASVTNAEQLLDRAERLSRTDSVARATVDDLRADLDIKKATLDAEQALLDDRTIRAPFAGTLGIRRISPGALVSPGEPLVTIDALDRLLIDFSVPEVLLSRIAGGQAVDIRSAAYPDRPLAAIVTAIDSRIDPITRTVAAVAVLDNPDGVMKPGMFLTVSVVLATAADALLVPEEALVPQGDQQFVFVVAQGQARRRTVTIGIRQDGDVQILDGLSAGDTVVVQGQQRLRDGDAVEVVETGAPAAGT
jgi:membrane fusion protein (multidrug efflux system)